MWKKRFQPEVAMHRYTVSINSTVSTRLVQVVDEEGRGGLERAAVLHAQVQADGLNIEMFVGWRVVRAWGC